MDKAWKAFERRVALELDGERVPVSGRRRGYVPDVAHDNYSIECKLRSKIPVLLEDAMDQAEKSIKGSQIPLVLIKKKGANLNSTYVVMKWRDWINHERGVQHELEVRDSKVER
jgi:hypothetical protein